MNSEWLRHYGVSNGTNPRDWIGDELSEQDLTPYYGPSDKEMDEKGIEAVFLGYYFEWDTKTSLDAALLKGFSIKEDGPKIGYYNFSDLDDDVISVHHFLKWYKFGFTRAFDNLCLEIRNGRMTREEAILKIKELGDQTPHEDIKHVCDFIGITTDDFYKTIEQYRNKDIWEKEDGVWKINDFIIEDWKWV